METQEDWPFPPPVGGLLADSRRRLLVGYTIGALKPQKVASQILVSLAGFKHDNKALCLWSQSLAVCYRPPTLYDREGRRAASRLAPHSDGVAASVDPAP